MKFIAHLILLLSLIICQGCNMLSNKETQSPIPPNVLLIIADDHGYADLSGRATDVNTPNLDRLTESGIHFKNAYATSPICSPSRVGLMTGTYHQRQDVFWYGGNGLSNPEIPTIAELLLDKGYSTGYFGKFHYGSKDTDINHRSFPLNHGFQKLFGCNGGRKHYLIHNNEKEAAFQEAMKKAEKPKQSLKMEGFWVQNERKNMEGFATELISKRGIEFMKQQIESDQPYFATVSFNAVHNFTHQLPEEYLKANNLKGYHDWNPEKESYYEWYVKGRKPNNPEGRAHYLGQLYYLDKEIGHLLDFLEQEEQLEHTLIIYIGDNGGSTQIYANNSPFQGGKYTMYEGGLRVPLIVSWKGKIKENRVVDNLVSAMDVLPTICEITTTPLPELTDGISLLPILDGSDPKLEHESLVWWGGEQAAIRLGNWKYRWANNSDNSFAKQSSTYEGVDLALGTFLHNLQEDIGEQQNLYQTERKQVQVLQEKLESWKEEIIK